MAVDRGTVMRNLSGFADAKYMKKTFGITISRSQQDAAERELESYKKMPDGELKKMDAKYEKRWPYSLTETQKYDKMLFEAGIRFNVTQTLLWQNVRDALVLKKEPFRNSAEAIRLAVAELEDFMKLNAYLGHFSDNEAMIEGTQQDMLLRLFNTAYKKYLP